jgi:hypothetical protein
MIKSPVAIFILGLPSCLTFTTLRHRQNTFSSHYFGSFIRQLSTGSPSRPVCGNLLQMKDASCSYWFHVGDAVQVATSVEKAGVDLKGRVGTVTETWEKCSVDPTCCCAEFVDENFAVTVMFEGKLDSENLSQTGLILEIEQHFTHHFNEDELVKVEIASVAQQ